MRSCNARLLGSPTASLLGANKSWWSARSRPAVKFLPAPAHDSSTHGQQEGSTRVIAGHQQIAHLTAAQRGTQSPPRGAERHHGSRPRTFGSWHCSWKVGSAAQTQPCLLAMSPPASQSRCTVTELPCTSVVQLLPLLLTLPTLLMMMRRHWHHQRSEQM